MDFELLKQIIILIISLFFLIKSSDLIIKSSTKIARMFKVSEFFIGFFLFSIATSLPELSIAVTSVYTGNNNLTIGNLMGANIADLMLINGLIAIFVPVTIKKEEINDLVTILLLTSIFPLLLIGTDISSKMVGFGLLSAFFIFSISLSRKRERLKVDNHYKIGDHLKRLPKTFLNKFKEMSILILSVFILFGSAFFVTKSASFIANLLSVTQSLIGATIISLSTTLPELVVSINAAKQEKFSLVLGNTVGSAMTNAGLGLGFVLLFSPFKVNMAMFSELAIFLVISNLLLWYFMTDKKITKIEGIISVLFYQIFVIISFFTGIL